MLTEVNFCAKHTPFVAKTIRCINKSCAVLPDSITQNLVCCKLAVAQGVRSKRRPWSCPWIFPAGLAVPCCSQLPSTAGKHVALKAQHKCDSQCLLQWPSALAPRPPSCCGSPQAGIAMCLCLMPLSTAPGQLQSRSTPGASCALAPELVWL